MLLLETSMILIPPLSRFESNYHLGIQMMNKKKKIHLVWSKRLSEPILELFVSFNTVIKNTPKAATMTIT